MKLQQFNGGISSRVAPQLIAANEAVESLNVDFTTGELTPVKSKTLTQIAVEEYCHYFQAENEWVSSSNDRDYVEYQEVLYYSQSDTYPKKYSGSIENRLGILAPETTPNVSEVLTQPPPPTAATLTQTTIGNIHAQLDNGAQRTLEYLFVNQDTYGLISETFTDTIALTGSSTNASVNIEVTGRVNITKVFRKFKGIYRLVDTITSGQTTIVDAAYDISVNDEYQSYGLTGTYQYVITYYNSADGAESQPSPLSAETILAGGVCKLSSIPISSDPQVDKRRIYRVGGTLTSFALVTEIDNTVTNFDDSIKDTDIDGRLLDSTYNNEAPTGLQYLIESDGFLLGAVGDKLRYSRQGLPNAWPSTNEIDYNAPITGLGVVSSGILVFTKYQTHIVVKTSAGILVSYPVDPSQGCISHKSIVSLKGALVWASTDGICTSTGNPAEVISRNKLGKLNLSVKRAVVFDEVYYLQQQNGTTLALDFRFAPAFNTFEFGVTSLVIANDTLYGWLEGYLYTLQSSDTVEEFTYLSPLFTEGEFCNRKTYKHIYMRSEGTLQVEIYIDEVLVHTRNLTTTDTHDLTVPQDNQNGYSLQFKITGTGTVRELEYTVMGRQNGR